MSVGGFLTLSQFNKWKTKTGRTHASYPGYKAWVTSTRKARAADPALQAARQYDQMRTMARQDVNTQIAAERADNAATTRAAQIQANNQATRAQGYAQALANAFRSTPQQVAQQYSQAADRINAYGTGLSAAADAAFKSSEDLAQQHLAATGAPTDVPQPFNPSALADVGRYLGTTMPAASLVKQGQQAENLTRAQNWAAVSRVADIAQQYKQKTTDLQSELALKQQALEKTRPKLFSDALTNYEKIASDRRTQDIQARAEQVQEGMLELNMAKTKEEEALARSKITDTLWVVDKKGNLVNTGQPTSGTPGSIAAANNAAANARAAANRAVQVQIANIRKASAAYAADTSRQGKIDAAHIAAAAKKAAAQVSANKNKPPTVKQQADIIKGVNVTGNDVVQRIRKNIINDIPDLRAQLKGETNAHYIKRYNHGMNIYNHWMRVRRPRMVAQVTAAITPALQLLKNADGTPMYGPGAIDGIANAIVSTYVRPQATAPVPVPPILKPGMQGPVS